jgi:DNA mismatch repair protein MutS2
MPTIFGEKERSLYNSLFVQEIELGMKALQKWKESVIPVIQAAIPRELETMLEFITLNARTDEEWKERQDKLKQIENEYHLVLDIKLRKIDRKEKIHGDIPEPAIRFEIGSRLKQTELLPKVIMSKVEIDLHGMTANEAKLHVEDFLQDCYKTHEKIVWIIHGKGTGVLRDMVQSFLKRHPLVKSFSMADKSHGGEGAIQVELKTSG